MAKVLYVEDNPTQRELMTHMLELEGLEIQLAENGAVGIEKAKSWQPNVILMDLRMPRMDGFETIQQIRAMPETMAIPVIVISAWTNTQNDKRALEMGANRCITKPYDLEELVAAINEFIVQD